MLKEPIDKKFERSLFDNKEKGIVVISVTAKNNNFQNSKSNTGSNDFLKNIGNFSKNTFVPKISKYEMYWLKDDKSLNDVYQSNWFSISKGKSGRGFANSLGINSDISNDQYLVYALDEGSYNLMNLDVFNSYLIFSGNNSWSSAGNYEDELANFKIKKGEVLYLGNLDILYEESTIDRTKHGENIKIEIDDEYEDAKSFLLDTYSYLANKLRKRLVTGSILTKK
jgi:hypothetical protein